MVDRKRLGGDQQLYQDCAKHLTVDPISRELYDSVCAGHITINTGPAKYPEEDQAKMNDKQTPPLRDEIEGLARQVEHLIETCGDLRSQNEELRAAEEQVTREKEELVSRNREAKRRIDLVVDRLRGADPS
jgi:cell division protein ZapB